MKQVSVINWFRNVSITKKLYFTVGIMAMLIAIELMILFFAINTLSSVRTYVGAEGLWSKGQKNAVYSLQKYGSTHNEKDYLAYQEFLKVNLGDHKARLELLKPEPDMQLATQGFLEGRVHPGDIDGAIKLVRRFYWVSYIAKAIDVWSQGDTLIAKIQGIGDELNAEINSAQPSNERINHILQQIDPINTTLTKIEDDFSYTLGEGSRWLTNLILKLLLSIVLTVEICGLSITIFVSRGISKGLNEILGSAREIAKGNFSIRARAFSQDEIGILANSFNDMTAKLDENIRALKTSETELNHAKEQAEQALVIKDHFLANMSHEIRTPMNAILGFTDLLESTPLNEEQQQFIDAIKISGQNLTVIINDILDYSKIKAGMVTLEKTAVNLRGILRSIYLLLQPKAEEKNLGFRYYVQSEVPDTIIADPTRLTQILTNLTDNALKFTEKGYVDINVHVAKETAEDITVAFQVKDTGTGIPEEKQAMIFERFTQATEDTTRRYGGTGLGLSIVKSLVDLYNGDISLKSDPEHGSLFSFTICFPKDKSNTGNIKESKRHNNDTVNNKAIRVLYAEDNVLNQKLVQFFSKNFNYETDIADNGKIAIDMLQSVHYDLVLMDIQMPEMDGYEATRVIRNTLKNNIPIIALTAHAMSGEKEKCLGLGMNDFVSKPFNPKELNEKIRALASN